MHIGAKIGAKKAVFCQNEETKESGKTDWNCHFFC